MQKICLNSESFPSLSVVQRNIAAIWEITKSTVSWCKKHRFTKLDTTFQWIPGLDITYTFGRCQLIKKVVIGNKLRTCPLHFFLLLDQGKSVVGSELFSKKECIITARSSTRYCSVSSISDVRSGLKT